MTTDTERTLPPHSNTVEYWRDRALKDEARIDALEARVKEVEGERDAARARRLASSQRVLTIEAEAYERCAQIAENYGGAVASNIAARIRHALKETPDVD